MRIANQVYVRALLVFGALLAMGWLAIAPPSWGGRLELWLLASGVALAAVIRWGPIQCIPIYAAEVLLDVANHRPFAPALVVATGLPLGLLATRWLLARWNFDRHFEHSRDVPVFVGAGVLGMIIPAAIGVGVYSFYDRVDAGDQTPWGFVDFLRWWFNDFAGLLVLCPLLIAVNRRSFGAMRARPLASLIWLAALAALAAAVLLLPPLATHYGYAQAPTLLASTVLVVVGCLFFGLVPASAAALILSVAAMMSFAFDFGSFAGEGIVAGLIALWTYVGGMIGATLLLTGLLAEQRRLEHRYEQVFETCPQPLWVHDAATLRFLLVNAATERLYGWNREELLAGTLEMLAAPGEDQPLPVALTLDAAQPLQVRQLTRSGRNIEVEVWARLIHYGGARAWMVFAFDVSERRALESALVDAVSAEQRRLGQELHDGLAQELTVALLVTEKLAIRAQAMQLPIAVELEDLTQRISACIGSARTIAHGLSPLTGSLGNLAVALTALAKSSSIGQTSVEIDTHMEAELRLPFESRNHLYRIAQEAVQNALKHAVARRILIHLTVRAERIVLEVFDDGQGLKGPGAAGTGFGTSTMRYRASAIGGRFSIGPRPGGGTVVTCSVPQSPGVSHTLQSSLR